MLMPAGERTGWKRIKKSINTLANDLKRKKKDFKEQQERLQRTGRKRIKKSINSLKKKKKRKKKDFKEQQERLQRTRRRSLS